MLSKPEKIRQVYNEFKRVFGEDLPAGVLLKRAAKFVAYIDKANEVESEFLRTTDSRASTPCVDVALADGGWKLLVRERDWVESCFDDEVFVPVSDLRKKYPKMDEPK